jgi:hypothetical protein
MEFGSCSLPFLLRPAVSAEYQYLCVNILYRAYYSTIYLVFYLLTPF